MNYLPASVTSVPSPVHKCADRVLLSRQARGIARAGCDRGSCLIFRVRYWLFAGSNGAGNIHRARPVPSVPADRFEGVPGSQPGSSDEGTSSHCRVRRLYHRAGRRALGAVSSRRRRKWSKRPAGSLEAGSDRLHRNGSTQKYLCLVEVADEVHAPFNLIYVVLRSARIGGASGLHLRVAKGRPSRADRDRIIERLYARSLDNLPILARAGVVFLRLRQLGCFFRPRRVAGSGSHRRSRKITRNEIAATLSATSSGAVDYARGVSTGFDHSRAKANR